MTVKKSERLIVKFITNQADQDEIEELTKWLEDQENQKEFKEFVKTNYAVDAALYTFDSTEVRKQIAARIQNESNVFVKRRFSSYYKYAAILILVFGSLLIYKNWNVLENNQNVIVPREDEIVLEMDNESSQTIDLSDSKNVTDKSGKIIGKQDKNKLVYSGAAAAGKLAYNTLKIPYGKKFEVELSDGTVVHLNSGSTLKFPVKFLNNQSRQVFLTGEAFFEVSKDKKHPFTVNTNEVDVEVLGTKFNVSSYNEDSSSSIVLVEGKVSLYKDKKTNDNQTYLTPGMKGTNEKGQLKIATESVNTDYYTAWVKGSLVFKNDSFGEIIKKLERQYNVTFINKNKTLAKEIFNARFDNEPIEVVLKYFSDSYKIDYKIDRDKITIN